MIDSQMESSGSGWPHTADELAEFIAAFTAGTWPRGRWNHRAHLVVAAHYVLTLPQAEATDSIRSGILHYNACQQVANTDSSGYHETLTLFWIAMVRSAARHHTAGDHAARVASIADALAGQRDLWREYYSMDILTDRRARRGWIEPDRGKLPLFE